MCVPEILQMRTAAQARIPPIWAALRLVLLLDEEQASRG